jgi:L-ascorbate metabolism protein UlaG (beta-lactamase superfamily)
MQIHFLRHATFILKLNSTLILVDPMLGAPASMEPFKNAASHNQMRNPLVELPLNETELKEVLGQVTGVIVSHVHRDHWDPRAIELLPKDMPILCQAVDEKVIRAAGFKKITAIQKELLWQGLNILRTSGRHGKGAIGVKMGVVSGFVLRKEGEPSIYIAGDTIWCKEVEDVMLSQTPDVVVVNAGAAEFLLGGPITMNAEDVTSVCHANPSARVIAVHMEAINHCGLTREGLRQFLAKEKLTDQVLIPADGETLNF